MNIYLFMGTHLPELKTCLEGLAAHAPESTPVRLFIPGSVEWPTPQEVPYSRESYSPDSVQWVFNPDEERTALILLDPEAPQIPQLERLAEDLRKCLIEPVKVITCVDCAAAEANPRLRIWLEASIYYSDIVLLGNRSTASKTFVRDFQKTYEKNCYPCLFLFLKGPGNPDQPLEILTPDTRRLSQLFDLPESGAENVPDLIIEASCDLDLEESEQDPFRQIDEESGQARSPVPDITELIVHEAQ